MRAGAQFESQRQRSIRTIPTGTWEGESLGCLSWSRLLFVLHKKRLEYARKKNKILYFIQYSTLVYQLYYRGPTPAISNFSRHFSASEWRYPIQFKQAGKLIAQWEHRIIGRPFDDMAYHLMPTIVSIVEKMKISRRSLSARSNCLMKGGSEDNLYPRT